MTMPTAQASTETTANQNSASSNDQLNEDIKALESKADAADGETSRANRTTIALLVLYAAMSFVIALSSLWVVRSGNRQKIIDSQLSSFRVAKVKADAQRDAEKVRADAGTEAKRIETEAQKRETKIIADAEVKIAEAQATAGQANEKAGTANERAGNLEKENLELRSGVANLEKEAADAKRAYLELQERLKDRHLTTEQRAKLVATLRVQHKGALIIWYVRNETEAREFALELASAIKEGGWTVTVEDLGTVLGAGKGLHIEVRDVQNPAAGDLQRALGAIGFPVNGIHNEQMASDIRLTVGSKP